MKTRLCVAAMMSFGALACGGSSSKTPVDAGPTACHDTPLDVMGMEGMPIDAQMLSGTFSIPVTVGSTTKSMVVDTGAPITLIDPAAFPSEQVPAGQGPLSTLRFGALTLSNASVIGSAVGVVTTDGPLAGLLGADLFCHFTTSFDYRQPRVTFGESTPPADLPVSVVVPAPIKGGGLGAFAVGGSAMACSANADCSDGQTCLSNTCVLLVHIPATRLVVEASVEGVKHTLIVDTGASLTLLGSDVFDGLVSDGRKTFTGGGASTVMGALGLELTRTKSILINGAEVQNSAVGSVPTSYTASLSREVGQPVDGLVGSTFLREFMVTADYAKGEVTLRRYPTRAHIHDELIRMGFTLAPITPTPAAGQPHWKVDQTFPGTDAAMQLTAGTKVVSIDGTPLEPLTGTQVEALELGDPGTTKAVQTDTATLTIKVEDLLAP